MLRHSDAILKLALALGALLAGAGIGFYYGVFLPSQEIRRQALEMAEKREQSAARQRALAEQAHRDEAAQSQYEQCVSGADASYRLRWTRSCQSLHDAAESAYADCADDLFSTASGCRAKHPAVPAQDCALPAAMARELTDARDKRKAECAAGLRGLQPAVPDSPQGALPLPAPSR